MSYRTRILAGLLGSALVVSALTGCSGTSSIAAAIGTQTSTDSTTNQGTGTTLNTSDMFTDRDKEIGYDEGSAVTITLSDSGSTCGDDNVTIDENIITIKSDGTYILTGTLSDGQIVVDAEGAKPQIVLDNVQISCDSSAAIYVKQADKVFVTLAAGSENSLTTSSEYAAIDDNHIDGTIYAKDDLTINGNGVLTVTSAYGHGIVSKDDLVITSGTITVEAAKTALSGKDSVRIADGTLTLKSGTDGIHSENTEDDAKGFIYIAGGDITIESGSDGVDGEEDVQVDGGTITIAADKKGIRSNKNLMINGGDLTVSKSYEALEGMTITINDGNIDLTASDDGMNAAGDGTDDSSDTSEHDLAGDTSGDAKSRGDNNDGSMPTPPSGDNTDGTMPTPPSGDNTDGTMPTPPSGDHTDGTMPTPPSGDNTDGTVPTPPSGDNTNGNMQGAPRGNFGGGARGGFDEATDYNFIIINGGSIHVNADGDGIDSNGDFTMTGGEVYVQGPTNGGNGALDYAGNGTITGGTLVAVGSTGMAMNMGEDSTQGSMLVTVADSLISGTITLTDADGSELVSYTPDKKYNSVVISCPSLTKDATYTLTAGDTTTTVEMTSLIYGESETRNVVK